MDFPVQISQKEVLQLFLALFVEAAYLFLTLAAIRDAILILRLFEIFLQNTLSSSF